jgi:rhamnosyltransferase subunit B
MHVVVVTIGSAGDLFPFLWMGRALRARGHRVDFLGPVQHEPWVSQAGLPFHGLPADPAVLDHPDLWHPTRGLAVVWKATRPAMIEVPTFVDALDPHEPRILLVHPLALPEAQLCRDTQPLMKIAAAYLAPSNLPTVHDPLLLGPWRVPRWVPHGARRLLWRALSATLIDPVALPDVNAARAAAGQPPVKDLIRYLAHIPDLSITLFPEWFAPTQPDWPRPLLRTGFPLYDPAPDAAPSPALEAFLAAGAPPVVFTPGTGNRQARRYFEAAACAAQELGLRAVFLTPYREQLPEVLPAGTLWQDYVPLRRLLPHAAALVHHGGIGTTAEALRAGTPQLVAPLAHDQFDNAARVEALGVGASLHARRLNAARLAQALRELLGRDEPARRAREVALGLAAPPDAAALCARLESLLAQ